MGQLPEQRLPERLVPPVRPPGEQMQAQGPDHQGVHGGADGDVLLSAVRRVEGHDHGDDHKGVVAAHHAAGVDVGLGELQSGQPCGQQAEGGQHQVAQQLPENDPVKGQQVGKGGAPLLHQRDGQAGESYLEHQSGDGRQALPLDRAEPGGAETQQNQQQKADQLGQDDD